VSERRYQGDIPEWLALFRFKYGIAEAEDRRRLRDFEADYQGSSVKEAARVTPDYHRWTSRCAVCGQVIEADSTPTQRLREVSTRCPVAPTGPHRWVAGYSSKDKK
jgi:hypothetical protein